MVNKNTKIVKKKKLRVVTDALVHITVSFNNTIDKSIPAAFN